MAVVDIESFKSGLKSGLAKPNLYQIIITGGGIGSSESKTLNLLANSVTLPGRTIATSEVAQHRETYKHPYTFIDDDVTIQFIIPNDFGPRTAMETWMKAVINPRDYVLNYKNDYVGTVEIYSVNSAVSAGANKNDGGAKGYGVRLNKAFPTSISAIEMGNENGNSIMTMNVTFAYDYYDSADATGGSISAPAEAKYFQISADFGPFGNITFSGR